MPRSRGVRLTGSSPTTPRSRGVRLTGSGAAAATRRSRGFRLTGSGATAVIVNPMADQPGLEPGSIVTVTASLQGGGVADSWTFRRVSGPAVGINGTGPTRTLEAPADIDGTTVVLGVTATVGGTISPERTVTLTVLPWSEWWWTGTAWTPRYDTFTDPSSSVGGTVTPIV